jgi:hypothetical protein
VSAEHLIAGSIWSDGRLHTGVALRLTDRSLVPVRDFPAGAPRRTVPGTLLPPLADVHVHSALVHLPAVRGGGISAVWDLGGSLPAVAALAGRPGMPAMRWAGPFLTAPGGYPSDRAWAPAGSWRFLRSADDATATVGEAVAGGATLIKATAHAGGPMLHPATLAAVAAAAHAAGVPLVVHAEGPGTVAAAYDAGADMLAHTPWTEELDPGLIRAAAMRMTWISTLDIHRGSVAQEIAVGNLRRFREAGGTVRYGTDLGNGPLPAGVNPDEIRALQRAGLSPADVLAAMATGDDADPGWIPGGLDLDPGRFADVLATARVCGPDVRPLG